MNTMTREEILAMEPGKELNALVARYVMHQEVYLSREEWIKKGMPHIQYWNENVRYPAYWNEAYTDSLAVADYSFDISAAWEVVEELQESHLYTDIRTCADFYEVWITDHATGKETVTVAHPKLPHAICKAALLAVLGEEEA